MDAALDDLVDTLGGPEETEEDNTTYTGPEVSVCDFGICKGSCIMDRKENKVMVMRHKRIPRVLLLREKQDGVAFNNGN